MGPCSLALRRLFLLITCVLGVTAGWGCDSDPTPLPPPGKTPPDAARSSVEVSRSMGILANGEDAVTVTVTVRNADGTPLPEARVRLEVSGEGNVLTPASGKADTQGLLTATLVSTGTGMKRVTALVDTEAGTVVLDSQPVVEFAPVPPQSQAGRIIISEFRVLGSEFVELHNTTSADLDIQGFTFVNRAGQSVDIRAPSNPNGTAQTPVVVPAGGFLYGVANPSGAIPVDVGFVYGPPGTGFSLADTGDALSLHASPGRKLEDVVDFRVLVTHPDQPLAANAFVAFTGGSTQLAPDSLTAADNDTATRWCVRSDSAGAANRSCGVAVINEVFVDATGTDDGKTFLEIAGPGGALIGGAKLLDVEGKAPGAGALNTDGDISAGETDGEFVIPAGTRLPADGILLIADATSAGTTAVPHFVAGVDVLARDMDPENGGGDALLLVSSSGTLLDAVGYELTGANLDATTASNGLAMYEVATALYSPTGASLMRSTVSADTGRNRDDFRADPSPTPGLPNDTVSVTVASLSPDDAPALVGANEVLITGTDLTTGLKVQFGSRPEFGCIVTSPTTARCTAPDNANLVGRVDVKLTSPASVDVPPVVLTRAFTYTGSQNETDGEAEVDRCDLQAPGALTVKQNQMTDVIQGGLFELGITDVASGAPSGVLAEVGYGNETTDPRSNPTWKFFPASFDMKAGNDSAFAATFQAPTVDSPIRYSYTYRFSFDDGLHWTYCDLNGAGTNAGLSFEPGQLGVMTVMP